MSRRSLAALRLVAAMAVALLEGCGGPSGGEALAGGAPRRPGELRPPPGSLGLLAADARAGGARVEDVDPESPAAGRLRAGDVVVEADGLPIGAAIELELALRRAPQEAALVLVVVRDGARLEVVVRRRRPERSPGPAAEPATPPGDREPLPPPRTARGSGGRSAPCS